MRKRYLEPIGEPSLDCLGNHIHILLREEKESISQIFKRIGSRYVYWYNIKYQRVGHLFQDRYKSEPVEDDSYLLSVVRYIHRNPVKAGISKTPEYKYSSYSQYINDDSDIIDKEMIFGYMSKQEFIEFHMQNDDNCYLDIEEKEKLVRLTDEQAKKVLKKVSHCENATEFQALVPKKRDNCIIKLKKAGLSIRQISRLTGMSYYLVQRL